MALSIRLANYYRDGEKWLRIDYLAPPFSDMTQ